MSEKPTLENPHYACPVCLSTEDPDYWQKHLDLARRARIGELCERFGTALMIGDETGCDEQMDGKDIDNVELVETWGAHARGKHGSGPTLLAALENLAKAIGGDDEN